MTSDTMAATPPVEGPAPKHRMVVRGEHLLAQVRELIHQGNVRRIIVIGDNGATILEIPLTAGVIGAIVAPVLVAIGAIAALASNYTLLIEATSPQPQPRLNGGSAKRKASRARVKAG